LIINFSCKKKNPSVDIFTHKKIYKKIQTICQINNNLIGIESRENGTYQRKDFEGPWNNKNKYRHLISHNMTGTRKSNNRLAHKKPHSSQKTEHI